MSNIQGAISQLGSYIDSFITVARNSLTSAGAESAIGCGGEENQTPDSAALDAGATRLPDIGAWRQAKIAQLQQLVDHDQGLLDNPRTIRQEHNNIALHLARNLINLGHLTYNHQYYDRAEQIMQEALNHHDLSSPSTVSYSTEIMLQLANFYLMRGHLDQAQSMSQRAIEDDPRSELTRYRALIIQTEIMERRGDREGAMAQYETIRSWSASHEASESAINSTLLFFSNVDGGGIALLHAQSAMALGRLLSEDVRGIDLSVLSGQEREEAEGQLREKSKQARAYFSEVLSVPQARVTDEDDEGFYMLGFEAMIRILGSCVEEAQELQRAGAIDRGQNYVVRNFGDTAEWNNILNNEQSPDMMDALHFGTVEKSIILSEVPEIRDRLELFFENPDEAHLTFRPNIEDTIRREVDNEEQENRLLNFLQQSHVGTRGQDYRLPQIFSALASLPKLSAFLRAQLTIIQAVYTNGLSGDDFFDPVPSAGMLEGLEPQEGTCLRVMPQPGHTLNGAFFAHNITEASVSQYEDMAGIQGGLDIALMFKGFIDGLTFPAAQAEVMSSRNGVLFIKLEPWAWGGTPDDQTFRLEAVANGDFDALLLNFASGAAMYGRPVMVSFAHEMNGTWYPWSMEPDPEHPGSFMRIPPEVYRRAFQHVVEVVSSITCNITWVWNPTIDYSMTEYFPGQHFANWMAFDGYDLEQRWQARRGFGNLFDSAIAAGRELNPDAPIMIGEFGSAVFNRNSVARSDVIGIFGNSDTSWQRFFENPNEENLRPRDDAVLQIHAQVSDSRKRDALLNLIQDNSYQITFLRDSLGTMAQRQQPGRTAIDAFVYFNYWARRDGGIMTWVIDRESSQTVFREAVDLPVFTANPQLVPYTPVDFSQLDMTAEMAQVRQASNHIAGIVPITGQHRQFGGAVVSLENDTYSCSASIQEAEGDARITVPGFEVSYDVTDEMRTMRSLRFELAASEITPAEGRIVLRLYTADNSEDENPSMSVSYTQETIPEDGAVEIDLSRLTQIPNRLQLVYYATAGGSATFTVNNLRFSSERATTGNTQVEYSDIDTQRIAAEQQAAEADRARYLQEIHTTGTPAQIAEVELEDWQARYYTHNRSDIDVIANLRLLPDELRILWQVQIANVLVNEIDDEAAQTLLDNILTMEPGAQPTTWRSLANPQERQLAALTLIYDRLLNGQQRLALFRGQNLWQRAQLSHTLGRDNSQTLLTQAREAVAPLLAARPNGYVHQRILDQQDKLDQHLARAQYLMADIIMTEGNTAQDLERAQRLLETAQQVFGNEIEGFAIQQRLAENLFRQAEISTDAEQRVHLISDARSLLDNIIRQGGAPGQGSVWLTSIAAQAQALMARVYLGFVEATSWLGGADNLERASNLLTHIPRETLAAIRRDNLLLPKYLLIQAEIQMRQDRVNTLMREGALRTAVLGSNNQDLIIRYVRGLIEGAFHFPTRTESIAYLRTILPGIQDSVEGETETVITALVEVSLGDFLRYDGDFASAGAHYRLAIELYPNALDNISSQRYEVKELLLKANLGLGEIHRYTEGFVDFGLSRHYYEVAQTIARESASTDVLTRAQISFALGELDRAQERYDTAITNYSGVVAAYQNRIDQDETLSSEVNALLAQTHLGLLAIYLRATGHQNPQEATRNRQAAQTLIRSLPAGSDRRRDLEAQLARLGQ